MILSLFGWALISFEAQQPRQFASDQCASGSAFTVSSLVDPGDEFLVNVGFKNFVENDFIDNKRFGRLGLKLCFAGTTEIHRPIEFFGSTAISLSQNSTATTSKTMGTYGQETSFGARIGQRLGPDWLSVGSVAWISALAGSRSIRNTSGGPKTSKGPLLAGEWRGLLTQNFREAWTDFPFVFHQNLGLVAPNSTTSGANRDFDRLALDAYDYWAISYAASAELFTKWLTAGLDFKGEYALPTVSPAPSFAENRYHLGANLRVHPRETWSFKFGGVIGLGGPSENSALRLPRAVPFEFTAALSFAPYRQKLEPPRIEAPKPVRVIVQAPPPSKRAEIQTLQLQIQSTQGIAIDAAVESPRVKDIKRTQRGMYTATFEMIARPLTVTVTAPGYQRQVFEVAPFESSRSSERIELRRLSEGKKYDIKGLGIEPIFFDAKSITPRELSLKSTAAALESLKKSEGLLRVIGHTESSEYATVSEQLARGLGRAEAVRDWLVAQGIPDHRIEVMSAGASEPLERGESAWAQGRNRRVEIKGLVSSSE